MEPNEVTNKESLPSQPMLNETSSLAERLDPAIGEATTGMGALLTELIRRTLKSGVQRIDDELQVYVVEQVGQSITQKLPEIQRAVETTARLTAQELVTSSLNELQQRAEERSKAIEQRSQEIEEQARRWNQSTVETLSAKINEVQEHTSSTLNTQIDELVSKSKVTATMFKDQISQLSSSVENNTSTIRTEVSGLADQLSREANARRTVEESFKQELNKVIQEAHRQIQELKLVNNRLSARVEDLEKPKGISGMIGKLFKRDKPT